MNDPLLKMRPKHRCEPHGLDPSQHTTIRVDPIQTTHQHQTVNDGIRPLIHIAVLPFFKGPDGVGPQRIIKVDLVKRIFVPIDCIEGTIGTSPSGTVVRCPMNYLGGSISQQGFQLINNKAPHIPTDSPLQVSRSYYTDDRIGLNMKSAGKGNPSKQSVELCSQDALPH